MSLYKSIVLAEEYNVMVRSEELICTTECLTLYTRFRINRCRYNRVKHYSIVFIWVEWRVRNAEWKWAIFYGLGSIWTPFSLHVWWLIHQGSLASCSWHLAEAFFIRFMQYNGIDYTEIWNVYVEQFAYNVSWGTYFKIKFSSSWNTQIIMSVLQKCLYLSLLNPLILLITLFLLL